MSYLSQPTSNTAYGVVLVGANINVDNSGVISLAQDISTTAVVTFKDTTVSNLFTTPNANITSFNSSNGNITGTLTGNVANITSLNVANANFAGTLIGNVANITTLNVVNEVDTGNLTGNNGSFSGNLSAKGNLVVTSVTPSNGAGISLSNVVSNGYSASFTVTNTGVLSLTAGTGITLSGNTGNITVSSAGTSVINVTGVTANYTATATDEYIGVNSTGAVTVTLPSGITGRTYFIKDEHGQGSGKITVQPSGTDKIDNASNYIISVPFQSIQVVYRGNTWFLV